jgi:AcrR family transcriptional regulator
MGEPVKTGRRTYRSAVRLRAAEQTRHAILAAARELFAEQGYAATTVAAVARRAQVAVDTVYATVGRKPALFRLLLETALSGSEEEVPADQRDYVRRIRQTADARAKLSVYASAVAAIQPRLAPLLVTLRHAGTNDTELSAMWKDISERRAANMRLFAADLAGTGQLRRDLTLDEVADIVWSMNAAEYWLLLVDERGWSAERFERWLADAWTRLLLEPTDSR